MIEKAERIQELMREVDDLSLQLFKDIQADHNKAVKSWEYLQDRREEHARELRDGTAKAYGAINALINIDNVKNIDVKKRGFIIP